MALREHLTELRRRLLLITIGLLVGAVAGWALAGRTMDLLFAPIVTLAAERPNQIAPNFSGIAGPLDMKLRVALFLGVLVSSPWWIYQVWAFVTPGLTRREKRWSLVVVAAALPLFFGGVAFAWWAIPNVVAMLTAVTPASATNLIDAQTYLAFTMQMMLTFGGTFLLPLFMVALSLAGVVRGRTWLRGWRWAVVLTFTVAALVTPTPDVLSMILVALPLLALYFVAVGVCVLIDRRTDRKLAKQAMA
jgi:sec-independent protein translocase protein TatC